MSVHHHKLPIVTDGLVFQVDAANGLGGNVTNTKNIAAPTEVGTFVNGLTVVSDEFDFDGVDDSVNFGNVYNNLISDSGGNANFTATSQVRPTASGATGGYYVFSKWGLTSRGIACSYGRSSGYFQIESSTDGSNAQGWRTANTFAVGKVYSVTYIIDNNLTFATGARRIFVNGIEETVVSFYGTSTNTAINPSIIGDFNVGNVDSNDGFFYGQIANCKIYDRTLTQAEITQNYEAQKHNFE